MYMRYGLLEQFKEVTKNPYIHYIIFGFLVVLASSGGFFVYRSYRNKLQQEAQRILSESIDEYMIMKMTEDADQYAEAERMFDKGYIKAKSSSLAPLFLIYKADAQALQGKLVQAQASLSDALARLPKESPYYPLYEIKKALLEIDAACGVQKCPEDFEALRELTRISRDTLHPYRTIAMRYLSSYYSSSGDVEKAQQISADLDKLMGQKMGAQGLL